MKNLALIHLTNMEANSLVPKLRFKEFNNDWETNKLNDIFNISAGGDISKKNVSSVKTEVFKYPIYANAQKSKGLYGFSNIFKIEPNVVTVAGRGVNIGIAHSRKERFFPIVRLLVLKPREKCNVDYFECLINKIKLFKESTGVPQLTAPQLSNYSVSYPSLTEQNKIASFLTSVDKKINLLTKKKALLETYKKGVMQKIFSQEIRFKDEFGNSYAVWEKKKLGELCKINTGKLDANAMVENGQYRFYTCAKNYYQIDKYEFDTDALIISGNGANVGYVHHFNGKFNAYQRTYVLDDFDDNIYYLRHFLDRYLYKRIYREKKDGATPYIVMSTLSDMIISLPSLEEQQKISDFLSSIDKKIELVDFQLERNKEFKKGLLQQMFV